MVAHRVGPAGIRWSCVLSHALMAAGMACMFAPLLGGALVRGVWQAAFALATAWFLATLAGTWPDGRSSETLGQVHHAVGNAAMVYMLAMPSLSVVAITTVLIAYFMVSVLVDGCLLAQGASQGTIRRSWETALQGGRILMAAAMVYMFAVMDGVAGAGLHHHHLG